MRDVFEAVMDLQPSWSPNNTEDMELRGYYIRVDGPDWIRDHLDELQSLMPPAVVDLDAEGRDGTGLKTEIPWYRLHSRSRSPRAPFGFYVVYLFDRPGQRVFVSLNQGTTRFEDGDFKPLPTGLLDSRVRWARAVVAADETSAGLLHEIDLEAEGPLAKGYERGNVGALQYDRAALPDEQAILNDLRRMARLLGKIYEAQDSGYVPGEPPPEVSDAEDTIAQLAGRTASPVRAAGFRPDAAQRRAVELRAMKVATDYLTDLGWTVSDVSARRSFDLLATKGDIDLHVEVKGTTSNGESVLLTRSEVQHQQAKAPASMLAVVSRIELGGTPQSPAASGGVLRVIDPWTIDPAALTVIGYSYTVPDADVI